MNESIPETKETPPDLGRKPNYDQLPIVKEKIKYNLKTHLERGGFFYLYGVIKLKD